MEPSELAAKDTAFASAVESNLIAGAVMGTTDESGDARIFATKLAKAFENRGGEIRTNCRVTDFISHNVNVQVTTEHGDLPADRWCCRLGSQVER